MCMNFTINDFNGPLDLLWHLIKSNKMDIYDINISEITKEYLAFISNVKNLTIDNYSEYLVMASELIHLKSKLLLNKNVADEDDEILYEFNNEDELKQRLLEYQMIKEKVDEFRFLEEKRSNVFTKMPENLNAFKEIEILSDNEFTVDDLVSAFESLLKRQKLGKPVNTSVTKKELSVEDKIRSIRSIIKNKKRVSFLELFEEVTRPQMIVTFLSILNMSKNKEIFIIQDKNFDQIFIEGCSNI